MKFKALRTLCGDYGRVQPGEVFEVPGYAVRDMEPLEANGIIERVVDRPKFDRKAYTVYENKAIQPEQNKAVVPPIKAKAKA